MDKVWQASLVGATGMVAGLATITASGFVGVQGALILGISGGLYVI